MQKRLLDVMVRGALQELRAPAVTYRSISFSARAPQAAAPQKPQGLPPGSSPITKESV